VSRDASHGACDGFFVLHQEAGLPPLQRLGQMRGNCDAIPGNADAFGAKAQRAQRDRSICSLPAFAPWRIGMSRNARLQSTNANGASAWWYVSSRSSAACANEEENILGLCRAARSVPAQGTVAVQQALHVQATASASISTSISGSTRRATPTKLVAGCTWPKNSAWALATSSQRSIWVT
jgi:hypothetical protein